MADLVRARLGRVEKNVGKSFAEMHNLDVLDEPTSNPDGTYRATTRSGGRRAKKKTTVDDSASAKKAAVTESAPDKKESDK